MPAAREDLADIRDYYLVLSVGGVLMVVTGISFRVAFLCMITSYYHAYASRPAGKRPLSGSAPLCRIAP